MTTEPAQVVQAKSPTIQWTHTASATEKRERVVVPISRVPSNEHIRVQELCERRGGRPGLSVLTILVVSVDVKQYWTVLRHWSQFVPVNRHPRKWSSTSSPMNTSVTVRNPQPYVTLVHNRHITKRCQHCTGSGVHACRSHHAFYSSFPFESPVTNTSVWLYETHSRT